MSNLTQEIEKQKVIIEHTSIIQHYQQAGTLDRQDALEKYMSFNTKYPEYIYDMSRVALASNSLIPIDEATNSGIIKNLLTQLTWLQEKSILK